MCATVIWPSLAVRLFRLLACTVSLWAVEGNLAGVLCCQHSRVVDPALLCA
jgi:hypothetical protein